MEVLIVGDIHGKMNSAHAIFDMAHQDGYDGIIQVGDFQWWPTDAGLRFVNFCDEFVRHRNMFLWVIDGNHDFPGDDENDRRGYRYWKFDPETLQMPGLKWLPRNTCLNINDKRVAFIGGAISIDRWSTAPKGHWFKEEMLTDEDVEGAKEVGPVDVLISHDRLGIPPHFREYQFDELTMSYLYLQKIRWREIFAALQPEIHFHGHFHDKYETHNDEWYGCHTIGLSKEDWGSFVGFDFATMEITHPVIEEKEYE